jgi:predicted regulator of Ras-like GTPase activity (Roadblock/LC7/MglB family)
MVNLGLNAKSQVARFPEVIALVVSDVSGALVDATGEVDGESVAAIIAVAVRSLNATGEQLGIGTLKRSSLTGAGLACVLAVNDQELFGIYVDPTKPLGAFEKKLDGFLHR